MIVNLRQFYSLLQDGVGVLLGVGVVFKVEGFVVTLFLLVVQAIGDMINRAKKIRFVFFIIPLKILFI